MECSICTLKMQVKSIEGIKVDVCEQHGVWLDRGEIETLLETAKSKGQNEGLAKSLWSTLGAY